MKLPALLLALVACKTGSAPVGPRVQDNTDRQVLAEDVEPPPPYGKAELQQVLIAERAAEARAERVVAELARQIDDHPERLHAAHADLAVRRRFIATLELCEQTGRLCPPRLDDPAWTYAVDAEVDPTLDVPLRFDRASWQQVAAELHGRACACRSLSCVDSLEVAIARLETRPMPDVQADEAATLSVTRARECLFRLRGKRQLPRLAGDVAHEHP